MKNKSLVMAILGLMAMSGATFAGTSRGGAKNGTSINYTTNVIGISTGPAVLYQVITATGAVGEFIAIFDSSSATGLTANTITAGILKTRLFVSTNSANNLSGQNGVYTFDPPMQFNLGIFAVDSAATGQSLFIFEKGRQIGN